MAETTFALNDQLAVQRWSASLAIEAAKKTYFSKFVGKGLENLIVLKDELHKGAGEKVTIGLRTKLSAAGAEGDDQIEGVAGKEEALSFFNDYLFIDQLRKSTKSKGKMSEQRVPYNLRKEGRDALSTWWAETMDENFFCYLSGARGIDPSFKVATTWTGRANNALWEPDAAHQMYAGVATAKNDMIDTDIIDLEDIERLVAFAETVDPMVQSVNVEGSNKFVLLMHTFQAFQLRTSITQNDWMDIHKATDRGPKALMYKNALGEYADVVLHKHRNVIRFNDYGVGTNLPAARALFLGAQAGLLAYGQNSSPGRYSWNEDKDDRGNALAITAGTIFGIKKTRYKEQGTHAPGDGADFGVIALDTYCPNPL